MTTSPTTSTPDTIAPQADPHSLGSSSERLADEPELRTLFGVTGRWLRHLRRHRRARYIDLRPTLKPGTDAPERYLYSVRDIEVIRDAERARIEAAREVARARVEAAPVPPPASPASPAPPPPTPLPTPLPRPPPPTVPRPAAMATLRGPVPEVIVVRRVGGARP
jgi:hypothetical protein